MTDTLRKAAQAALDALELAEQEMRMAGWTYFQPDNIGRMDAMQAVRDAIAMLTAEPDREAPMPSQVANHFSTWGDHKTSKDFAAMGAQTPFPQSALQDTNCTLIMREQGKAYPRTCPRCGLGPCAYIPLTTVQKLSMNQDAAGLLHDKAHVDTGKVRAAQSVRTPEMSYRPGSLPMEDEPVAKKPGTGLIVEYGTTLHDYDINGFPSRIPFEMKPITLAYEGLVVFTPGKLMEVVRVDGSVVIVKQAAPLRDLSDEEIDKAWRSATIDYTAPYDQFRIDVARAIIDAARKA